MDDPCFPELLIVPYGIETIMWLATFVEPPLLIVPYGIETCMCSLYDHRCCLLIVPYGIETHFQEVLPKLIYSFNRTLWN